MRACPSLVVAAVAAVAVAVAACGDPRTSPVDSGPLLDAGDDSFRIDKVGTIQLIEGGFLGVYASIQDRAELPTPVAIAQRGDCTVFDRPAPSLCDPACTNGVCTAPNMCTPYAANASAGRITVTGLRQALTFVPGSFGYVPEPSPPTDNLFDPGVTVEVSAPGDVTPAFAASLSAPDALVAPFQNVTLRDGEDATVTWTAAGGGATIQVALLVGWHGAPPEAMMICETADDGSLTIPGALVTQLPRATSSLESHPSWIVRFDRAVVAAPAGPIEILVGSQTNFYFAHP